ncbi:hypothetical protein D3C73_1524400 [compost metagenome]
MMSIAPIKIFILADDFPRTIGSRDLLDLKLKKIEPTLEITKPAYSTYKMPSTIVKVTTPSNLDSNGAWIAIGPR